MNLFDRVAPISIPVSNQAAAKQFYVDKLGCTVNP